MRKSGRISIRRRSSRPRAERAEFLVADGDTERRLPMIIDFHVHVLPPADMEAFTGTQFHRNIRAPKQGRSPTTIENALEAAKIGGVDITVISNPIHNLRDMDRRQQLDRCKRQNQFNAACQAKYDSIVGMASTVPYGGDEFLREFERAVKEDGLKGAWITSSLQGSYPDDDAALPFFQLATELDVPVVIHPPSVGFGEERMKDYRLASSVGRPMDNALALARLIVRGIFEKFPSLKLVGTHLGGGICEMIGRMSPWSAARSTAAAASAGTRCRRSTRIGCARERFASSFRSGSTGSRICRTWRRSSIWRGPRRSVRSLRCGRRPTRWDVHSSLRRGWPPSAPSSCAAPSKPR